MNDSDEFLDITGDTCPMTFVKTKLRLEKMAADTTLLVRLKGHEPLDNVPRSVTEGGDSVEWLRPEDPEKDGREDIHLLLIRKS